MRQAGHVVDLGVEFNKLEEPRRASEEIVAVETVMGGVDKGVEQLVTAARKACPNPNCCLSAEVTQDTAEGGAYDPHPMNDTTYTVSFIRVEVGSKRLIDCAERADRLTDAVASMATASMSATGEAEAMGKEKTDAAAQKAKAAMTTPAVTRAQKTVETAEAKAKKMKSDGAKEAKKARNAVYARTKREIVASLRQ